MFYQLNNNGDLLTLTAGCVTQNYQYNLARGLELETLNVNGKSLTLDYAYNTLGHLSSLTYPDAVVGKVNFLPNAFGQATQAIATNGMTYAQTGLYHPSGTLQSFTYGNGLVHTTEFNTRNQPSKISDVKGSVIPMSLSYTYDNQSNITSITDNANSAYSLTALTYDGLDRLTSTTGGTGIGGSTLAYDSLGNITQYTNKGASLSYNYDTTSNRLTDVSDSVGSVRRDFNNGYDARGNVTNNGERGFNYNLANQMVQSGSNTYLYDGFNRRVKTVDSKGTKYSMYSQSGKLLYRETEDGPISYIFMGGKLVAKDGYLPPAKSGDMHYKPFGDSIETAVDAVGFTGHKFDKDLGLSYMQARYYDPVIGRFMSNDPIGFRDIHSFNRYTYVNNNPYRYTDPDGREGADFRMSQRVKELSTGVISTEEYWGGMQAQAAGAAVGLGALILGPRELVSTAFEETTGVELPSVKNGVKTLALGRMDGLKAFAKKEGAVLSTIDSKDAKTIYKQNSGDIRAADKIVFKQGGVPNSMEDIMKDPNKGGQFSRAEKALVNSRADLQDKTEFK